MPYLSVDTETGGLSIDSSLLQLALIVADDSFNVVDILVLNTRPDNGVFHVTSEALEINKINLRDWHKDNTVTYKDAGTSVYKFIKQYSDEGKNKLTIVGKNVYFDLQQLWDKIIGRGTWETFCSYRLLDVSSVWLYLEKLGRVPVLESSSLASIVQCLKADITPDHTAYGDALATLRCMEKLMRNLR